MAESDKGFNSEAAQGQLTGIDAKTLAEKGEQADSEGNHERTLGDNSDESVDDATDPRPSRKEIEVKAREELEQFLTRWQTDPKSAKNYKIHIQMRKIRRITQTDRERGRTSVGTGYSVSYSAPDGSICTSKTDVLNHIKESKKRKQMARTGKPAASHGGGGSSSAAPTTGSSATRAEVAAMTKRQRANLEKQRQRESLERQQQQQQQQQQAARKTSASTAAETAPTVAAVTSSGKKTKGGKSSTATAAVSSTQTGSRSLPHGPGAEEKVWVQCNTCDKWRCLPSTVDPDSLPDIWTCDMNVYDPEHMTCDAPEETAADEDDQHVPLKSFLRVWAKKMRCADRGENRLSTSAAVARSRKRNLGILAQLDSTKTMPKVSRRKLQLRERFARNIGRSKEQGTTDSVRVGDEDSSDDNAKEGKSAPPPPVAATKSSTSSSSARKSVPTEPVRSSTREIKATSKALKQTQKSTKEKDKEKEKEKGDKGKGSKDKAVEDEKVWVQCNECDKWRALPSSVDPDSLPDIWTCDMNHYDPLRMSCGAPEESYKLPEEEQHVPLKSFLKVWTKKLKCTDRAENRLSTAAQTRGKKRKLDAEWIQCSNPSCGKWRAVTRNIETANLLKRLNKGRHFGGEGVWYCSMNSWDETTASCAAPQEPLWNARWNLNNNR
eukprot:CAMPEP_0174995692 /NCGR_PEP_ID=MMETSP0004_2-20121128/24307_1 /TAXON_ID=420556 /ORGANISM="Ochromonas sp., Strain CCMP1393" /LENGTH=663 /DNA_ID=CAMNT_0016250017 /DNA_START=310 /DNA_END=2301 /DNA_ORIENTATION=+